MKRRKTIDDTELIVTNMHLSSAILEMTRLAKKYMEVGSKDADYILQSLKHLYSVDTFLQDTCGGKELLKGGTEDKK